MSKNAKKATTSEAKSTKRGTPAAVELEPRGNEAKKAIAVEYPCACGANVLVLHTDPLTDAAEEADETNTIAASCRCTFKCTKCEVDVLESLVEVGLYYPVRGECCRWEFIDGSGDSGWDDNDLAPYVAAQTHGRNFYGGRPAESMGDFYLAFVVHFGCEQCGETDVDASVHPVQLSDFWPTGFKPMKLAK